MMNKSKTISHKNQYLKYNYDEKNKRVSLFTPSEIIVIDKSFFDNIISVNEYNNYIKVESKKYTIKIQNCNIKLWNKLEKITRPRNKNNILHYLHCVEEILR